MRIGTKSFGFIFDFEDHGDCFFWRIGTYRRVEESAIPPADLQRLQLTGKASRSWHTRLGERVVSYQETKEP